MTLPAAWNRPAEPTPDDLAAIALDASMQLLAQTVAGSDGCHRFAPADRDMPVRFRCPLCRARRSDGGPTARALDGWRWTCDACRVVKTRRLLARITVEDAELLARLAMLVRRRQEASGAGDG